MDHNAKLLWMGSRDLRRIYAIDPKNWTVVEEKEAPGIPWAAVGINGEVRFTIGEGADDDRYIYRYTIATGFSKMFACSEFTGSYLSFDREKSLPEPMVQEADIEVRCVGNVIREIDVGAEICGQSLPME